MFTGEHTHTLDGKGRLTIPSKFRAALAGGCFIARGFDKNLIIYTKQDFDARADQARKLSITNPDHRDLWRMFYGSAHEDTPDSQGRVMLPQHLREYAGLDGEVHIIGVGDFLEVWAASAWADKQKQLNDPVANAERFAALDLSTG